MRSVLLCLLVACGQGDPREPEPGATTTDDTETPPVQTTPTTGVTEPTGSTGTTPDTVPIVANLALTVDADMVLMLHAAWDDPGATESWVEYRFEGADWLVAPVLAPGDAVILGIPAETTVEARVVMVVDGVTRTSETASGTTGALPPAVLTPEITHYDPALASPAQFVMMSVGSGDFLFDGPYYVQIVDRAGRVVWYHLVPKKLISLNAAVSLDGTHIWFEGSDIFGVALGDPEVTRQTLDGRWSVTFPAPPLGQAIAEGPDQSFFLEHRVTGAYGVDQMDDAGVITPVWDCDDHFDTLGEPGFFCQLNSCMWDASRNTVMASQFQTNTVFEVDVATGEVVRQMGELTSGEPYTFDPPGSMFAYQHYPYLTPEGTLFVSTHVPCPEDDLYCEEYYYGIYGVQRAAEYAIDDVAKTLTLIGYYETDDIWATQAGEAYRLPNDNIVQGYGQDAAVREVTSSGQIAWHAQFASIYGYDEEPTRLVGHASFIEDLYALNVGL